MYVHFRHITVYQDIVVYDKNEKENSFVFSAKQRTVQHYIDGQSLAYVLHVFIQGGPKKTGPFFEVHNFFI